MSLTETNTKAPRKAQVAAAKKVAPAKRDGRRGNPPGHRTTVYVEKAKALKAAGVPAVRLLDKATVLAVTSTSYTSIWKWMREGTFPRARTVNGRVMWLSTDVERWLAKLPLTRLKGDAEPKEHEPENRSPGAP